MASKFNIVAELSLRGPKNLKPLVRNIQKQLQSVNIPVNVQVNANTQKALNKINSSMKGVQNSSKGMAQTATVAASNLAQVGSSGTKAAAGVSKIAKQSANASKQLKQTGDAALSAANKMKLFGEQAGLAVKRFAAFSIPTGIMIGFTTAISNGFREAIEFERELVKIAQVSGRTVNSLRGLTKEITRLATTFGVSSQELLETSRILAQTGMTAKETQTALGALAKASLAPTFKDMNDTVEASIAAMRQFGIAADQLESKLGAINAVAGSFAVEASDISFAIRRTGGAFKAAGGQLEELIALFTSVRSTTRESAETIATGFRTIFTRIQRPQTIAYLRELGVELQNTAGQFVGPMEAIKRLNAALAKVPTTDPRFSQIVEQIGGYRQVSKVIPLITRYNETVKAYIVAQSGATSLTEDANKAQGALSVQLQKTKEEFSAFLRNLTQDNSIQDFVKNTLQLARAFIKVADSAKSFIPMLASIAAFKGVFGGLAFARGFGQGLTNFGGSGGLGGQLGRRAGGGPAGGGGVGIAVGGGGGGARQTQSASRNTAALTANSTAINNLNNVIRTNLVAAINNLTNRVSAISMGVGGGRTRSRVPAGPMRQQKLPGFASGGVVGGQGTGDSVAAMLTPGEFVIKRSSAKSIGYSNLASMNEYASGGKVKNLSSGLIQRNIKRKGQRYGKKSGTAFKDGVNAFNPDDTISFTRTQDNNRPIRESDFGRLTASGKIDKRSSLYKDAKSYMSGNPRARGEAYERIMTKKGVLGPKPPIKGEPFDGKKGAVWQEAKSYGEKKVTDRELADKAVRAALLGSNKIRKAKMTGRAEPVSLGMRVQAVKDNVQQSSSLLRKLLAEDTTSVAAAGKKGVRRARGGGISGSDTVPAMLTPGEYVINAKSARNIGYGALNAMNKGGTIKGFNKGGSVGVQKFNNGGQAGGGQGGLLLAMLLPTIVANFQAAGEEASDMAKGFADFTAKMTTAALILTMVPKINMAGGMGMGGFGASASAFGGGLFGRRSPIMQAGVPVPREGSALAQRQAAYDKGKGMRGQVGGMALMAVTAAGAAAFSVMAESARKQSDEVIKSARSMEDAARAIQLANKASKMEGASTGAMAGGAIASAGLMAGVLTGGTGLLAAAIITAIGAAIGYTSSGDDERENRRITQDLRKKLVNDSSDAIRDALADVEARRASFEAKSGAIRTKLLQNEARLRESTGDDFTELQRQLRSTISDLYSMGNRLVDSSKNLDDFKNASGGLGKTLIRQIALIRGLPVSEVEKQFTELIEAQRNSVEAQKKLAESTRTVLNKFKAFDLISRRIDRTVHSLNNMGNSLDRFTNTMFGEFAPYERQPDYDMGLLKNIDFSDIREPGRFNAAVSSLVSPFGAEGEKIKNEAGDMANAMSDLPRILKDAQRRYLAGGKGEDFGRIVEKMIGDKFGALGTFIIDFIKSKLSTAEGESALIGEIDKDPTGFAESMLSGPSKALAGSISELASVTEAHAAALDNINAKRLIMENRLLRETITLARNRLSQERELRNITGTLLTEDEARGVDRREVDAIAAAAGINLGGGDAAARRQFVQGELIQTRKDIARKEAELDAMDSKDPGYNLAAEELNNLKIKGNALGEVFKKLNDSSNEYINTVKQKIQTERRAAQQLQSGATQYAFGTDEQRQSMDIGAMYAMSGIPIDKVPSEYRGNVSSIYKSLSDVELAGFGGITAEEKNLFNKYNINKIGGRATGDMAVGDRRTGRAKELYDTYNFLKGRGFDEETAAKIAYAGATTKEEDLINGLKGYLKDQQTSQEQFLRDLGVILRENLAKRQEAEEKKAEAGEKRAELMLERDKKVEAKRREEDAIADKKESVRAANSFEERVKRRAGIGEDIDDDLMGNIINAITSTEVRAKADERRALKDTFDPQTKTADEIDFRNPYRFRDTDPTRGIDPEDQYVYNSANEAMSLDEIIDQQKKSGRSFLSDAEMLRFRGEFAPSHDKHNDALADATEGFGRGQLSEAEKTKVHGAIDAYSASVSGDIAKKYGLSPELQEALNQKIKNQLKNIAFDDEGNYRGNVGGQARGLIDNQAFMEYLGTDVARGSGNKAAANRAFIDELDAVARQVYGLEDKQGSEFGTLSAEQQKLILSAVAEGGAGEGQAELQSASLAASEGLKQTKADVDKANEAINGFTQKIEELTRLIATEGVINRRGEGQGITREALTKATSVDLSKDDNARKYREGNSGQDDGIYYDTSTGQYFRINDGSWTGTYLSKGGMLGAFQPKGKDTIPAMLAKGEAVLTPEQMGKLGITGKSLKAAGVPTVYASGGVVLGGAPSAGGVSTLDDTNRILISILDELKKPSAVGYFENGGSIFKPKGTDTVPAMLTPGEFVIKKSSVDKYGSGMLGAINNGYFQDGGMVGSQKIVYPDTEKASFSAFLAANKESFGVYDDTDPRSRYYRPYGFDPNNPVWSNPNATSYYPSDKELEAAGKKGPTAIQHLQNWYSKQDKQRQEMRKANAEEMSQYKDATGLKIRTTLFGAPSHYQANTKMGLLGRTLAGPARMAEIAEAIPVGAYYKVRAAIEGTRGNVEGAKVRSGTGDQVLSRFFKEGVEPLKIDLHEDKDLFDQFGPLVMEMIYGGAIGAGAKGLTDDIIEGGLDAAKVTKAIPQRMPSYMKRRGFIRTPDMPKVMSKVREIMARGKKRYQDAQPAFLRRTDSTLNSPGGGAIGSGVELTQRLTELRKLHKLPGTYTDEGIRIFDAKDLAGHGGTTPTGWKIHINPKDTIGGVDTRKWLEANIGPEKSRSSKYLYKYQPGNKGMTLYGKDGLALSYDDMIQVSKELETKIGKSNIKPGQDITIADDIRVPGTDNVHARFETGKLGDAFTSDRSLGLPMHEFASKGGGGMPGLKKHQQAITAGKGLSPAQKAEAYQELIDQYGTFFAGKGADNKMFKPDFVDEILPYNRGKSGAGGKGGGFKSAVRTTGAGAAGGGIYWGFTAFMEYLDRRAKEASEESDVSTPTRMDVGSAMDDWTSGPGKKLLEESGVPPSVFKSGILDLFDQAEEEINNPKPAEGMFRGGLVSYFRDGGMAGFNRQRGEGLGQKKRWREEQARKAEQEALRRAEEIRKEGEQQAKKQQPLKSMTEAEMYPDAHAAFRDGRYAEGLKIMRATPGARGSQLYGNLYKSWYFKNFKELEGKHDPSMSPQEIDDMYDKRDRYLANEQWARENYHSDIPTPMPYPNDRKELERHGLGKEDRDGYGHRLENQHPFEVGKRHSVQVENIMTGEMEDVHPPRASIDPRLTLDGREHMNYRIRTGEQTSEDYKKFIAPFKPAGSRIYLDHIPLNPDKSMSNVSDGHVRYAIALSGTTEMPDPMSVIYNPKQRGFIAKRSEYYSQTSGKILPLPTGFSHVANPIDYYDSLVDRYGFSTLKNWHEASLQGKNRFGIKGPLLPSGYWKYDENGNITGLGGGYYQDGGEKPKFPPRRPGDGAFPDTMKQRLQKYSRWNTKGGKSIMAKPIAYKDGWVNFDLAEAFDGQKFAAWPIHDFIDEDNKTLNAMKNKNFDPEQFFMGGKVTPWATNPAMLGMIMRMYGSPKGLRGAGNKGLVKSKDYYTKVDDKDAFIDPLTGKKTIYKGAIERRQKYHMGRNKRMFESMKGRNPMMTTGTKEYQRWVKNPDFDPTQPKGAGNEMFLPRDQMAAVSGRMPLLETLDKSVPGNASALQQEVFRGMHVDYGKGDRFNAAQRARLTRRVDGSFGRLLQTGLFTSAGSIENLNLTRDNADWVYRLLKKAPMSADMAEIRMAYRRVMNYKGKLGDQAVKPLYDPYEVSGDKNITGNKDAASKDTTNWSDFNAEARAHKLINKDYIPEPSMYNTGGLQNVEPGPVVKDPAWRPPPWSGPYPPGLEGITPKMWAGGEGPHGGTLDWRLDQLDFHHPAYANEIRKWLKPDTAGFGGQYNQYWSRGGKILGLNDGGSVPGVGNTDSIPAMLTPGEYVVNAQSAGKHAALLRAINNGNGSTAYLNEGGQAGGGSSSGGSFGGFSLGGFGAAADKIKQAMSVLTSVSPMFASFTAAAEMINNALSGFSVGTPIQHIHSHTFSGSVNIDIVGMDITDEIESRLRSVGTDMVNAQLISVLTKMSEGEAPSTIAAGLQTGGTNAGS